MSWDTVALIVAAGSGSRFGGPPKQYLSLAGRALLAHSRDALAEHPAINGILIVIGAGQEEALRTACGDVPFVLGGDTRRESVRNGLEAIAAAGGARRVLIHDAARPFVPAAVIDRLLLALDEQPGAVPVLLPVDTMVTGELLAREDGSAAILVKELVDRSKLFRVQTPQAFDFGAILEAHRTWPNDREATDDAQVLRHGGGHVLTVPGDEALDKITWYGDWALAEHRAEKSMRVRTAMGFDVHRLEAGEELWLGGILIPHDRGLSGHSDADVGLHALTDALLGAIAEGDIGTHFPPSDPQWRGASSDRFLVHAAELITARGGVIDHVDLTIICEAPKIGPHRPAMRERIARLLGLPISSVSVKATTTERLGFAGRGEGIAANAVATVRVPL